MLNLLWRQQREKRTIGTINYAKQAGEVDDEEIPGNKISSG